MRNVRLGVFGALALALAATGAPAAQESDQARNPQKQTPDTGIDKSDDSLPPGQAKKLGERAPETVPVTRRADGVAVAFLDESFEEALVAQVAADGSISYVCLHGLPAAAKHVQAPPAPVSVTSILEEK